MTGTDAMVFEALVYLCRERGSWKGSYSELAGFSCCGTRENTYYVVKRLIAKGLVLKDLTGALKILTESLNISTISKEERTKEENINKKESGVVKDHTTHTTFLEFFKIFSPNGEYKSYEISCKKIWEKMPEDWRKLAIERGSSVSVDRNPLFYLRDEDFLKVGTADAKTAKGEIAPHWLSGEEQDDCLRAGIALVVCKNEKTDRYGVVTKEEAEKFGLTIKREM